MNKLHAVLLGIVIFLPVFLTGCDPSKTPQIDVVSVKLEDWKNPKDGMTYVVALPTWKNAGNDAVRQVAFMADIKGAKEKAAEPAEPAEPQFYGAIVEPGTTVTPQRIPEDGVVLGVKEDLEKKYGPLDPSKVEVVGFGSIEDYKPPVKKDA